MFVLCQLKTCGPHGTRKSLGAHDTAGWVIQSKALCCLSFSVAQLHLCLHQCASTRPFNRNLDVRQLTVQDTGCQRLCRSPGKGRVVAAAC
jgi:hypothetical protein